MGVCAEGNARVDAGPPPWKIQNKLSVWCAYFFPYDGPFSPFGGHFFIAWGPFTPCGGIISSCGAYILWGLYLYQNIKAARQNIFKIINYITIKPYILHVVIKW